MNRLRAFLAHWWPLLLVLAVLACVLAAAAVAGFLAAALLAVLWLLAVEFIASSVGHLLRRRSLELPPAEAATEIADDGGEAAKFRILDQFSARHRAGNTPTEP